MVVPGGQWDRRSFSGAGGINLIRVSDRTSVRAYPAPTAREMFDAKTYKSCPGVPDAATKAKFQTHGLSLREGRNGVHTLMTVTHGAREAIDVFTLDTRTPTPTLTWIGCAVAPDPIGLNSVRWLDDGGFIATNFSPRGSGFGAMQKGEKNGELWEWHTASGWQKVPGSEASGANGIEISPDGKTLYVAAWSASRSSPLRGEKEPKRDEVPLDSCRQHPWPRRTLLGRVRPVPRVSRRRPSSSESSEDAEGNGVLRRPPGGSAPYGRS